MELTDNILKVLGIVSTASTLYLLIRESPFKLRSSKASAEDQGFGLYTKAMNELAERDEGFSALREQLRLERTRGDDLEQSIIQFRRMENTNADEIRRLKRENKILRAILSKNGWLTPAIEAEIAAGLEAPPTDPPTP